MSPYQRLFLNAVSSRGRIEYFHNFKSRRCSAFEMGDEKSVLITIPVALGATSMFLEIYDESGERLLREIEGVYLGGEAGEESYSFNLDMGVGLYYASPRISVFSETLYGRKDGLDVVFDGRGEKIQLSISDFRYVAPEKMYGGTIYHIFVDRFARGGEVVQPEYVNLVEGEWEVIPEYPEYPGAFLKNNTFYGGNLYGIIDKLDYIASLGVSALYLSPIFESVSNHKYDTADYMKVDCGFGGEEALKKLIKAADARGIKIILDGVFNHTGSDSFYFNKKARYDSIGAYQAKESQFFDWFDFKEFPDKYTCWWDIEILPRINPDKASCREFFTGDDGVISKYKKMGVYGFRLDVADELSDDFISEIKTRLSSEFESVLYGEVWEDASNKIAYGQRKTYYLGKELDGVMNYPLRKALIEYVNNKNCAELRYVFDEVFVNTPERILNAQMNFLGTHDTERILTILGNSCSSGFTNAELSVKKMDKEARKLAERKLMGLYTVLATLPGVPTIFYGDEAGLEGYHDPFNRMPYPWGRESLKLISRYKAIGNVRKNNPVYKNGVFKLLALDTDALVFERKSGKDTFVTVFNNSDEKITIGFDTTAVALLSGCEKKIFDIEPFGAEIFKISESVYRFFK